MLMKKDKAAWVIRRAQDLLNGKANRIRDARETIGDATRKVSEATKAMQTALDSGDVDAYMKAKEENARAQAFLDIKRAKAGKAGAVTDDDREKAKGLCVEAVRAARELDQERRKELIAKLYQIREEAMTEQKTINELNQLSGRLYQEFVGPGIPETYQGMKMGIAVLRIESAINALLDEPIIFRKEVR